MRILGIDYGDSRVGVAITDPLGITAQGIETIHHNGNDKIVLKRLEELLNEYEEVETIVVGMPYQLNGDAAERAGVTEKFIHKLKCKFNTIKVDTIDERLTTVAAHKTMNLLEIKKTKKREIVDTLSAVYILETYIGKH